MSSVSRSVRNVFRNKARTFVVILIIGMAIGVFLSMTIVNANISDRTTSISDNLDTTITVSAAGSFGPMNAETMDESIISSIGSIDHVNDVQVLAMVMEETDTGGTRQAPPDGAPPDGGGRVRPPMIQGEYTSKDLVLFNGGSVEITDGRTLDSSDTNLATAIIGTAYSDSKSVVVGNSIYLNGTQFEVVGIYSSGTTFGDNGVIISYSMFKDAYAVSGPNMLYVYVDSIGNMEAVEQELKDTLGSEYDVVPLAEMGGNAIQDSIDSISANSKLGSIVSLITAAVVMIFVMILVTRERIKEIGVMKAVGFKNSKIITQFFTESIALATIGFVIGIVIAMIAGPFIASALMGTSTSTSIGGMGGRPGGGAPTANMVSTMDFTLTADLMIYTLVLAIVLGIVGSFYPIFKAIKLKPAEALRYDE